MNRTERAIKKQHREAEVMLKKKKQKAIAKMHNSTDRALFNSKEMAAEEVKKVTKEEKEQKKITHNFKKNIVVLSEKSINKEVVRV